MTTRARRGFLQRKDGQGLTLNQKRFVSALALRGNIEDAAEEVGVTFATARTWVSTSGAVPNAIDNLFTKPLVVQTGIKLVSLMPKVGEVMEEALDADQAIKHTVVCPECDHSFIVQVQAPEWATRLRASEDLLKVHGMGQTSKLEVEGKVEHELTLSLEDRLALAKYRRNQALPPGMEESLRDRGLLQEGVVSDPNAVDGEFEEMESPEEAS